MTPAEQLARAIIIAEARDQFANHQAAELQGEMVTPPVLRRSRCRRGAKVWTSPVYDFTAWHPFLRPRRPA